MSKKMHRPNMLLFTSKPSAVSDAHRQEVIAMVCPHFDSEEVEAIAAILKKLEYFSKRDLAHGTLMGEAFMIGLEQVQDEPEKFERFMSNVKNEVDGFLNAMNN